VGSNPQTFKTHSGIKAKPPKGGKKGENMTKILLTDEQIKDIYGKDIFDLTIDEIITAGLENEWVKAIENSLDDELEDEYDED
jgi:hypothetical protein